MTLYLGTTALAAYWPEERPLHLLGKWCLPRRNPGPAERISILPYPWDDRAALAKAALEVEALHEKLLIELSDRLNRLHSMAGDPEYWRVVISPWLLWFLEGLRDRFACLDAARAKAPDIVTIGLPESKRIVPADTDHFVSLYLDDAYNLQIYTELAQAMGIRCQYPVNSESSIAFAAPSRHRLSLPFRLASRVALKLKVAFVASGLSRTEYLKLFVKTKFQALPVPLLRWSGKGDALPADPIQRQRLELPLVGSEFEKIARAMVPKHIPVCYVEGFGALRVPVASRKRLPKAVFSSMGWFGNEELKILAAESRARGGRVYACQHGGYYGMLSTNLLERHEQRIGTDYYTWGWKSSQDPDLRAHPMPALRMTQSSRVSRYRRTGQPDRSPVLVTTAHPRYLLRMMSHPVGPQWERYYEWGLRFAAALSEAGRSDLETRLYVEDFDWGVRERWNERFPNLRLNSCPMVENLERSRLMVIDHPATTLLEAFAADVPALLFWDSSLFEFRPSAERVLSSLRAAEILQPDPERAAKVFERIRSEPLAWWNRPEALEARRLFKSEFARSSEGWLAEWKSEVESWVAR